MEYEQLRMKGLTVEGAHVAASLGFDDAAIERMASISRSRRPARFRQPPQLVHGALVHQREICRATGEHFDSTDEGPRCDGPERNTQ